MPLATIAMLVAGLVPGLNPYQRAIIMYLSLLVAWLVLPAGYCLYRRYVPGQHPFSKGLSPRAALSGEYERKDTSVDPRTEPGFGEGLDAQVHLSELAQPGAEGDPSLYNANTE